MDDDEDNDERGDEENEDDDEPAIRSYSKKKHFGKSSRDLKLFGIKTVYKPRIEVFKVIDHQHSLSNSRSKQESTILQTDCSA
jgi:hypothetical protein